MQQVEHAPHSNLTSVTIRFAKF